MTQAYRDDLAYIHDAGFGHIAENAAPVLLAALRRAGFTDGLVVELGCGSGILSEKVAAAGYAVLGIDLSPAMIKMARKRVPTGRFRVQSLLQARLPPCRAVAAVGECFNYLFDPSHSKAAVWKLLGRIHEALLPGGLLIFDVAGPGRVPGGLQRGYKEGAEWAVLYAAEEAGDKLTRRITSFRKVGDSYRRAQETHHLRLFTRTALTQRLRKLGFKVRTLANYGPLQLAPGHSAFLARKQPRQRRGPDGVSHVNSLTGLDWRRRMNESLNQSCHRLFCPKHWLGGNLFSDHTWRGYREK